MQKERTRIISLALAGIAATASLGTAQGSAGDEYLRTAVDAAHWIESTAIPVPQGVVWPADPHDSKSVNTTLYAGTPGPILFFFELYQYTGDTNDLAQARKGADALLASMKKDDSTGLYEGLAGTGFTLGEAYLFTRDKRYRDGALRCVDWLQARAKPAGKGVEWGNGDDIIGGAAGTGLFLLWADQHLKAPGAHELAVKAGNHLIETAERKGTGKMSWLMSPQYPEMPNFAHGTAGVAYFLSSLYLQTGQKQFLDAALAGANYLISIADTDRQMCLIYHDAKHKNLFYLSWCHGPAGDARLFYQLYRATKDQKWIDWMKRCANAMIAKGAPGAAVTPGEWNNISACCGTTAQAEFFLDMYEITHDPRYLDLARKGTNRLVSAVTRDEKGARWIQAEHRVKPDLLIAQTGYMQGASGVGMWLVHMGAFTSGEKKPVLTFPDNPFRY